MCLGQFAQLDLLQEERVALVGQLRLAGKILKGHCDAGGAEGAVWVVEPVAAEDAGGVCGAL